MKVFFDGFEVCELALTTNRITKWIGGDPRMRVELNFLLTLLLGPLLL